MKNYYFSLSQSPAEAPIPPPESLREATPQSSPSSLPMDPASPQRDALLRAPTLDLTLPEALDGQRQEEDSEGGEEGKDGEDSDSDVNSDGEEEKSGDIEEEKPLDWAEEVKEKKATKKPAREWVCETSGCKNPVKTPLGIQCPECMTLGIQGRFFCSQACFGSSWTLHKEVHKKARKEEEEEPSPLFRACACNQGV